jgi:hypothetical protein
MYQMIVDGLLSKPIRSEEKAIGIRNPHPSEPRTLLCFSKKKEPIFHAASRQLQYAIG